MAISTAGRRLTEAHRLAQARLNTLIVQRVRPLWRLVDPEAISETVPTWIDAVVAVVAPQHAISVQLADRYFRAFRTNEIGQAPGSDLDTAPFDREALATSLVVTGPVTVERAIRRGENVDRAADVASVKAARAAARHTVSGGRQTLMRAVANDRRALGWARATSGSPCHFCALVASRGPVFQGERSADFEAHDGCNCTPEPVFDRDAPWPPGAREYADLYREAAQGETDPLNAFRRAYEGRA